MHKINYDEFLSALRGRVKGKVVMLGIGNELRGDDGFGPYMIEALEGKVESLVPVADPASRKFVARIAIPSGANAARPGGYASGRIITQEHKDVLVVPKDAIVERDGKTLVFVVEEAKAVQREVVLGLSDETRAEVVSGVKEGEKIIVEGAQGVKDGDPVIVQEPEGA